MHFNFLVNTLDNTNNLTLANFPDGEDVSMAIGWDFTLLAGETAVATFILSETDHSSGQFTIGHADTDSPQVIYFWTSLNISSGADTDDDDDGIPDAIDLFPEIIDSLGRAPFPQGSSLLPMDWAIPVGEQVQFVHNLGDSPESSTDWTVNGISGGNNEVGTIDSQGIYTAPTTIPVVNPVTVRAALAASLSSSVCARRI